MKKVTGQIKLQIPAGKANPAPPVGPALGQAQINIMEICKQFNARTSQKEMEGLIIPVVLNRCDHDLVHGGVEQVPKVAKRLKPVDQWERPNDAYDCARDQISRAIARHYGVKYP